MRRINLVCGQLLGFPLRHRARNSRLIAFGGREGERGAPRYPEKRRGKPIEPQEASTACFGHIRLPRDRE